MNRAGSPPKTLTSIRNVRLSDQRIWYAAVCVAVGIIGPAVAQTPTTLPPAPPAAPTTVKATPSAQAVAQKGATPATVFDDKDVETILGREIYSSRGEDMGRIVDVLVDHRGNVRAAIIDFGGFLGVGTRKIAVDWRALKFGQDRAVSLLTRDQVRVAPQFQDGEPVVAVGPASPGPPAQQNTKAAATAPAK